MRPILRVGERGAAVRTRTLQPALHARRPVRAFWIRCARWTRRARWLRALAAHGDGRSRLLHGWGLDRQRWPLAHWRGRDERSRRGAAVCLPPRDDAASNAAYIGQQRDNQTTRQHGGSVCRRRMHPAPSSRSREPPHAAARLTGSSFSESTRMLCRNFRPVDHHRISGAAAAAASASSGCAGSPKSCERIRTAPADPNQARGRDCACAAAASA
jgi:hypothetical protein